MGLGLGYVEILSACFAVRSEMPLSGASYESVPELIESFQTWLNPSEALPQVADHSTFKQVPPTVYDSILSRSAGEFGLNPDQVKDALRNAILSKMWVLEEAFSSEKISSATNFHCVAYDAFSSKTSPELWSESFLIDFLRFNCATPCVLSTYACTGALKRALTAAGFHVDVRPGFASKRDSTFAYRLSQELYENS